jgi:hypothetical protein
MNVLGDSAQSSQYAMTVLVPDIEEAQRLAAALDEVRRAESPLAVIAVPPVRGLAFFADSERQAKLDRWWAHAIPVNSVPVYLLLHEEGIAEWLPGLDGVFVVGVPASAHAELYRGLRNVTVAPSEAPLDIALAAVALFAGSPLFREDAGTRLEKRLRFAQVDPAPRFRRARLRPSEEALAPTPAPEHWHPIPNVPPSEGAGQLSENAGREDLVRALAATLRRLERIRSTS